MTVDFFENIDKRIAGTIIDELNIEFIETNPDRLVLKMPITPKTHQLQGFYTVVFRSYSQKQQLRLELRLTLI
ncbi:hypothetical protein [Geomicrobium sp. JCM 19038]|uniref:hypothetical protein n=1 Tax=Geomicrobium sp. JCM 19038 TaxID=1460635 RepID=UPI00045F1EE4|nr:hypothetical protein [Geomicrobium sp. JCM 19038]GAK08682.1 hypothetical protein JCM19038_2472 [Geomicrobium sp. JCM 19038]